MNKKRDRLHVIYDILKCINEKDGKIKPTHILYKSNLSHQMMEEYIKKGYSNFVISSSGNAALAALKFVQDCNKTNTKITLKIFIGKNIAKNKLSSIQSEILNLKSEILVEQVDNPKQSAFLEAKNNNKVINLRQSTDDLALEGYKTLADELEEIDNLEAIFIPTSSGTTAQALGNLGAQIHVVQTTACHPIAEFFSPYQVREHLSRFHIGSEIERGSKPHPNPPLQGEGKSIAGAIVDKIAHRKEKIIEIIKNSHGFALIRSFILFTKTSLFFSSNPKLACLTKYAFPPLTSKKGQFFLKDNFLKASLFLI